MLHLHVMHVEDFLELGGDGFEALLEIGISCVLIAGFYRCWFAFDVGQD